MIGNQLENDIIGIFNRDPTLFLSINQISKRLKKAYPHINSKVNALIKQGILNKTLVGRSCLCSINLQSDKAIVLLSYNEIEKKESYLHSFENAESILSELRKIKSDFQVYTIFVQNKQICFVIDHIYDKEAIKNSFPSIRRLKPVFMSKSDFQKRVESDKSFITDPIVLYSPEAYYELISENYASALLYHSNLLKRK